MTITMTMMMTSTIVFTITTIAVTIAIYYNHRNKKGQKKVIVSLYGSWRS